MAIHWDSAMDVVRWFHYIRGRGCGMRERKAEGINLGQKLNGTLQRGISRKYKPPKTTVQNLYTCKKCENKQMIIAKPQLKTKTIGCMCKQRYIVTAHADC